jgi:hypothetical protein
MPRTPAVVELEQGRPQPVELVAEFAAIMRRHGLTPA